MINEALQSLNIFNDHLHIKYTRLKV